MENEPTKLEFVDTPEELQKSLAADAAPTNEQPQAEPVQEQPVQEQPVQEEPPQPQDSPMSFDTENAQTFESGGQTPEPQNESSDQVSTDQNYSFEEEDLNQAVYQYMSEKLGREINSLDDFNTPEQQPVDESVEAISNFVRDTGRSPSDWFAYQSLNPSEMDDLTAVRVNAAAQYPGLSNDELNLLVSSKYKLDPDTHSEDQIKLAQLQLKIDGNSAKQEIEKIRSQYAAPIVESDTQEYESFVNEDWLNTMSSEEDSLEGLEIDLAEGKSFKFGLNDTYKSQLKESNVEVENFFDQYVQPDGEWNFDKFNSHRAVIDNIDAIVASAYRQGLGDGQKGLVNRAANVSTNTAQRAPQVNQNSVATQLKNIMSGRGTTTFKL